MAGEHRPGTVSDRLATSGHPALTDRPPLPTRLILVGALLLTAFFGLLLPAFASANVNVRALVTITPKEYDGNTNAAVATCTIVAVGTTTPTLDATCASGSAGATFDTKDVGTNKLVSITPGNLTATGTFCTTNTTCTVTQVTNPSGAAVTGNITAKPLTATITAANKAYDGNTNVTGTPTCTFASGVVGSEVVTCAIGSISFANKNVGTNKTVTASGLTLGGANAGNYSLSSTTATTLANITAKTLIPTLASPNKVYDGTTAATGTTCTFTAGQVISGDAVTCNVGSATFANKNVGTAKTVSITGLGLTGTDATNYALSTTTGSTTANITAKSLTPTITTPGKVYDGTTAAPGSTCTFSAGQVVAGDSVTCTIGAVAFDNKNAGPAKTVTATGLALTGADVTNYSLPSTTATGTSPITPKAVTATISTPNKVFNDTTDAPGTTCTVSPGQIIPPDVVSCVVGSASFDSAAVGNDKPVTATDLALVGPDGFNYVVEPDTATTTASILALPEVQVNREIFKRKRATFYFASQIRPKQVEYRCSLNGSTFTRCTSPKTYSGLKRGRKYTFRVRATLLGETGPVSRVTWRQAR